MLAFNLMTSILPYKRHKGGERRRPYEMQAEKGVTEA
jgi:hypothetical protein